MRPAGGERTVYSVYVCSRFYNPEICRWINADDYCKIGMDSTLNGYNLFLYCSNNPVVFLDYSGEFLISTAVLIGSIIGFTIGAVVGGSLTYRYAKENGKEGKELKKWTILGIAGGGLLGGILGAYSGYVIGYWAGGTYANGLAAKSVDEGINNFMSQPNKVGHALTNDSHKLVGYTDKMLKQLLKTTLKNGSVGSYKSVLSAYLSELGSEVTFLFVDNYLRISDAWFR